ncbi:ATP-grasp domain-containing protein [Minwuia thermotolerans]|uniref:RimK-like protein n=1 Tax=Minwuia thermotolerans TaxID=2056226 RepID=A0A2M9FZ38_9PROT|nr:RimK-like protein [Minwuia thermotolerans]PJK28718.1 RimK-like protein [Minwuia thermotolerans]
MPIRNDERLLVEAVVDYAERRGLALTRLSHDWILVLEAAGRRHLVFGYDVGLNGAACLRVANDKAASFEVLRAAGVPMIEHRLFLEPIMHRFTGQSGNWQALLKAFADFGGDVVVKANEGTSGNDVHRVDSVAELERVVHMLLQGCRSIALSPFVEIAAEQRFVILDGEIVLAYDKTRPAVVGDGERTLRQLAAAVMTPEMAEAFGEWLAARTPRELDRAPDRGEIVTVGWRHNLGHGARPKELESSHPTVAANGEIALRAAEAVGLRFGSVDIAEAVDGVPAVMEINAGVMLEHFARAGAERRARAVEIYQAALARAFDA